jgi:hypothetical protein
MRTTIVVREKGGLFVISIIISDWTPYAGGDSSG